MSFSAKITGIKSFERSLNRYKTKKEKQISDAGQRSALNVEREAKSNVRTDMGRLKTSIRNRDDKSGLIFDVYTDVYYAPFEEFGTGRHVKVPPELEQYAIQFKGTGRGNFNDLVRNITDWASRNGIPQEAVYPISIKIAKEGREGKAFLFPAWEQEKPRYMRSIKRIIDMKETI